MLQFLIKPNDKYSIAELGQQAIEGGAEWLQVCIPNSENIQQSDDLKLLTEYCKESGVILMFEDNPDMAKEFGVHGVHLRNKNANPGKVREDLGAEAIIGVEISSADSVKALIAADIDYATINPTIQTDIRNNIISTLRNSGITYPVVVEGDFKPEELPDLIASGFSGVCIAIDPQNPTQRTSELLCAIKKN